MSSRSAWIQGIRFGCAYIADETLDCGAWASAVSQRVDELALVHLRAALDADVGGLLLKLLLRLVLVLRRLAALLGRLAAARLGVGDPRRLLLARAVVAQRLVGLVVLDGRAVVLGHAFASSYGLCAHALPEKARPFTRPAVTGLRRCSRDVLERVPGVPEAGRIDGGPGLDEPLDGLDGV